MTYPTDAQIKAAHDALYASFPITYTEIGNAILDADRAAWVTDGSVPNHNRRVLCKMRTGIFTVLAFKGRVWTDLANCVFPHMSIVAWREITGPEEQ